MENKKIDTIKQLKIKTLKEQWVMWSIAAILAFALVVVIGTIISAIVQDKIPWEYIGIAFSVYVAVVLIVALISRLLYRGKLIVTESEVIKLHGEEVQFRIRREDLLYIGIRRTNFFMKLLIILSPFIGDLCTDMVSFRFKEADICETRKFGQTLIMSSLTEEDNSNNIKEFVECISYQQAKKISTMLQISIKDVKF